MSQTEQRIDSMQQIYLGVLRADFVPYGSRTLRGGIRTYTPCVLDQTRWANFYLTLPKDYDIKNDPVFNLHRSTYNRLMDVKAPVPEPATAEMLRTGFCGPDRTSLTSPAFLRNRDNDKRPEPAFRLHLTDRTTLHHLRADPLEGVLPFGRSGDTSEAESVSHRDFHWHCSCPANPPKHETMDRKVHRFPKTDLHGRFVNEVVTFDDDFTERYFEQKLMKLKKAWHWPINPITRESLGGHLLYHFDDPCTQSRKEVWPCNENNITSCDRICIPEDRCSVLANKPKDRMRARERHFHQKSYLDMRYPIRNYECWEEVPACCGPKFGECLQDCCTESNPNPEPTCPPKLCP